VPDSQFFFAYPHVWTSFAPGASVVAPRVLDRAVQECGGDEPAQNSKNSSKKKKKKTEKKNEISCCRAHAPAGATDSRAGVKVVARDAAAPHGDEGARERRQQLD